MATTVSLNAIEETVHEALAQFGADPEAIHDGASLAELNIDSLDMVELVMIVEDEYGIRLANEDLAKVRTVGDAVNLIGSRAG
jgi:acyl carrier protein